MSYLWNNWIWLSFGLGFAASTSIISLMWLIRIADVALFGGRIPLNARVALAIAAGAGVGVFGVWYFGNLAAHFHNALPYAWSFLLGVFIGLALVRPLSRLGPRYPSAS